MDLLQVIYNTPVARRPPHWRWALAHHCTIRRSNQNIDRAQDAHVYDAVVYKDIMKKDSMTAKCRYRALSEAESIYNNNAACSEKWAIEAWICAKASDEEIAERFYLENGPKTVRYYRKLFFDIEYYQENDVVMYLNVFNREQKASDPGEDFRYVWKMVGYQHGVEGLEELFGSRVGKPLSPKMRSWMNEITRDRMGYMTFVFAQDVKSLRQQSAQFALDTASRNGSIKEQDGSGASSDDMNEMIREWVGMVGMMATDERLAPLAREEKGKREQFSKTNWDSQDDFLEAYAELYDKAVGE